MSMFGFDDEAPLDEQEFAARFREAQTAFKEGRKTAALQILNELNKARPENAEVLYAIGLIRLQLNHSHDAELIVARLRDELKDPRAEKLAEAIAKARQTRSEELKVGDPALAPQAPEPETAPTASGGLLGRLEKRADQAGAGGVGSFADHLTGCTVAAMILVVLMLIVQAALGTLPALGVAGVYVLIANRVIRGRK